VRMTPHPSARTADVIALLGTAKPWISSSSTLPKLSVACTKTDCRPVPTVIDTRSGEDMLSASTASLRRFSSLSSASRTFGVMVLPYAGSPVARCTYDTVGESAPATQRGRFHTHFTSEAHQVGSLFRLTASTTSGSKRYAPWGRSGLSQTCPPTS